MSMLVLAFATRFSRLLFNNYYNNKRSLLSSPMAAQSLSTPSDHQNVVVLRHGDRLDNIEKDWVKQASKPWDPPLHESGLTRAFNTGRTLRKGVGFPIHRVLVSPFLRCVQTAVSVISGISAGEETDLKVSIEYGLCEMLNDIAIRSAPKDWEFVIDVADLEARFPSGTVDRSVEPVYKELPKCPEEVDGARERYNQVFKALADKYPNENLLLVTHGEGVGVAVSDFMKENVTVYGVDYCAYVVLKRPVVYGQPNSTSFVDFEVQTHEGIMFMNS